MKTIATYLLLFFVILVAFGSSAEAQTVFQAGSYYTHAGPTDCQCGPSYSVHVGFDYWGRPITQGFQNCRERRWYSYQGGAHGYFWINGYWQPNFSVRTWWAFDWFDFQRRVW